MANQYIYNFTDHLGNVRLSYTDTNKDGIIQPRQYSVTHCTGGTAWYDPPICFNEWQPGEIVENNNYYPFWMLHNIQNFDATGSYFFPGGNRRSSIINHSNIDEAYKNEVLYKILI
ncbi:hypothetical protein [Chryseobacterium defluvii]|uniref:hypothetical protein n=1 Tax=Chryseobacterium defluvii TaxID=160396 RepID=UPI000EB0054A|nr:hypothetical protein [Chryseobacterium defluvii]